MRLYRTLMRLLLPPDFRREFGAEIRRAFAARLEEAGRPGRSRARVWCAEAWDLVRTGAREWSALAAEVAGARIDDTGRGDGIMQTLARDIRYAFRTLMRAPVFTAVVVTTLGLGIGANTAIFSVVDAVLLEGLPYDEPDRLVNVWQDATLRGGPDTEWFNFEDYDDLRAEPNLLEAAGAWNFWQPTLTGIDEPVVLSGVSVTHAMLSGVFRARPQLGRFFLPADDTPDAPGVVVLSHRTWQDRFGGDPGVLGRSLTLSEVPHTVIGVAEPGFQVPFAPNAELFRAMGVQGPVQCTRGCYGTRVVGRLAPGVSVEQAHVRARALAARLEEAYPGTNTNLSFNVVGLQADLTRGSARGLWVLLGAVGFVLLIACTNVANLLLARAAARDGEISVRVALGAGRGTLFRQLLTESLLLAAAGGLVGVVLAWWGTGALLALAPDGAVPRLDSVSLDLGVLGFTAAITLLTGVLFGLLPSWGAARPDIHRTLRATGRSGGGLGAAMRRWLVVLQVAMAMVLLVGSGLLIRSFDRLNSADLGFEPDGVLALQMALPGQRYTESAQIQDFYFSLLDRLRAVPGVEAAGAVSSLPLAGQDGDASFLVEGEPPPPPGISQAAWTRPVTEGYFEAAGLDLVEGRDFTLGDDGEAPRVVLVNETLAERYYGGDAVGRRLAFGSTPDGPNWRTIVGVVGDVRHFGLKTPSRPAVYFPYRQVTFAQMAVAVRTSGDPTALTPEVRRVIADLDPSLAASGIRPLRELVDQALGPDRFVTLLLGLFALTALILAAVGVYGVISYGVTRRYREMGIRLALGADGATVRRLVVRGGLGLVGSGVVLGLVGALGLTRLLQSLLFGIEATDPFTFATTTLTLTAVAMAACWIPALRASRADPVRVLREE
ncbi:MAG: ABC transporter permease [Longimicrobiales bacterium]